MKENEDIELENKKLKEEVEMYLKAYENVLTEKILIQQEYENYKESIEEKMKTKNQGIYGNISVYNNKTDNTKNKSEQEEISKLIWEFQTNLSIKDEQIRILEEKNKQLENEINLLKEKLGIKNDDNKDNNNNNDLNLFNEEKNENNGGDDVLDTDNNNEKSEKILNMKDLYSSTVLQKKNKEIENKIKESTIIKNRKKIEKVNESVKINST